MEFRINIKKRHAFAILAVIVFVGIVIAYGGTQPNVMGHTDSEIRLPVLNQNLDAWSGTVETRLNAIGTIPNIQIETGSEKMILDNKVSTAISAYNVEVIPFSVENGVDRIVFRLIQSFSAIGCAPGNCDIVCDVNHMISSNEYICSAGTSGQNNCGLSQSCASFTGQSACTPGADWITFRVTPNSGSNSIGGSGFSQLVVELCDHNAGGRQTTFDAFVVPYYPRINGVRFETNI